MAVHVTNTFDEERGRGSERYHIPASGHIFGRRAANIHPGKDDTYVDYKNPNRAAVHLAADHLMPPSISSRMRSITGRGTITR